MPKRTRGPNCSRFRYHFRGILNGVTIDEQHHSQRGFLDRWGGTVTPLRLNRQKLGRLVSGYYDDKAPTPRTRIIRAVWRVKMDRITDVTETTGKTPPD